MYHLKILTTSTRPGRKGKAMTQWVVQALNQQHIFSVEVVDLKTINLPFLDESAPHPLLQEYQHAHTKAWSQIIDEADTFIFVICEYHAGFSAPLKNALDYLFLEWQYKPVGFVGYGGISGGIRAIELVKPILSTLKLVAIPEAVIIPNFSEYFDQNQFISTTEQKEALAIMVQELGKWTKGLKTIRKEKEIPIDN